MGVMINICHTSIAEYCVVGMSGTGLYNLRDSFTTLCAAPWALQG